MLRTIARRSITCDVRGMCSQMRIPGTAVAIELIRGQFSSIATAVPGMRICEHMPLTSQVMDRLAIVRSMHHPMTNHNAAAFTALSGRDPLKGDLELLSNDRNDPPCYGATLSATLLQRR